MSERGRRAAAGLGKRRRGDDLAAIFVSDLHRAVETAEIGFGDSDVRIYHDTRLRECNYGALNGMPVARLVEERPRRIDESFPRGESYRDVVARTRGFLCDLAARWDGETVLVIAHSANKWALDYLLKGIPLETSVDAPFGWQEGWRYNLPSNWMDGCRKS